jgi:beta-phosphoglucomutase-like phosphatase (HAD superfamily)
VSDMRVLILDLGNTLVADGRTLPHVEEALTAISELDGATGEPLQLALVSDFHAAEPPTPAGVQARFSEYLALLDGFGLRSFFEPVDQHVTLSTQAEVNKPDRRIYQLALTRLGNGAGFADCLSITEDAGHVSACRALGMQALQFGVDFDDWSQAPDLVRGLIDPAGTESTAFERSLRTHGQLVEEGEELRSGATHRLERDDHGDLVIKRNRFNAL